MHVKAHHLLPLQVHGSRYHELLRELESRGRCEVEVFALCHGKCAATASSLYCEQLPGQIPSSVRRNRRGAHFEKPRRSVRELLTSGCPRVHQSGILCEIAPGLVSGFELIALRQIAACGPCGGGLPRLRVLHACAYAGGSRASWSGGGYSADKYASSL